MTWFGRWFGYGFGAAAGKAIFGEDSTKREPPRAPIRPQSEAEIRADERRYDEDEKRLERQTEPAKVAKT